MQGNAENVKICSDHEECRARLEQIKLTKGFSAKESVKGQMVSIFPIFSCIQKEKKKIGNLEKSKRENL